jgi:hypothetical protein
MEIEHIEYREDNRPPVNAAVSSGNQNNYAQHAGAVAALAGPSSGSAIIDGRTMSSSSPFGRFNDGGHKQQGFGTAAAAVELSRFDVMKSRDGGDSAPVAYLGRTGGWDDREGAEALEGHGPGRI